MTSVDKSEILNNICYTKLAYNRINKKLNEKFSKEKIEENIFETTRNAPRKNFNKIGKNIYISNLKKKIRITINSNTFRIITADKLEEK